MLPDLERCHVQPYICSGCSLRDEIILLLRQPFGELDILESDLFLIADGIETYFNSDRFLPAKPASHVESIETRPVYLYRLPLVVGIPANEFDRPAVGHGRNFDNEEGHLIDIYGKSLVDSDPGRGFPPVFQVQFPGVHRDPAGGRCGASPATL